MTDFRGILWFALGLVVLITVFATLLGGFMLIVGSVTAIWFKQCSSCGYDLRGHRQPTTCPECGADISDDSYPYIERRPREFIAGLALILVGTALLGAYWLLTK